MDNPDQISQEKSNKKSIDGFEINKIVAALLIALLASMIASLVGNALVSPIKHLKKNALIVDIPKGNGVAQKSAEEKPLAPIGPLLASANAEKGEKIFKKCMQCHSIEKEHNQIGPSLWGIIGRGIAALTDYAYSGAMKEKAAEKWDIENLNHFIHKPRNFIKGTKMSFMGLETDTERADLIAYLQKAAH